jgi:hypothetical protein
LLIAGNRRRSARQNQLYRQISFILRRTLRTPGDNPRSHPCRAVTMAPRLRFSAVAWSLVALCIASVPAAQAGALRHPQADGCRLHRTVHQTIGLACLLLQCCLAGCTIVLHRKSAIPKHGHRPRDCTRAPSCSCTIGRKQSVTALPGPAREPDCSTCHAEANTFVGPRIRPFV